jgi:hypothetical protein
MILTFCTGSLLFTFYQYVSYDFSKDADNFFIVVNLLGSNIVPDQLASPPLVALLCV